MTQRIIKNAFPNRDSIDPLTYVKLEYSPPDLNLSRNRYTSFARPNISFEILKNLEKSQNMVST